MSDLLVRAARGERTERPPVWLMRQAGRHIPEYREIREEYSFLEAIKDPEVATRCAGIAGPEARPRVLGAEWAEFHGGCGQEDPYADEMRLVGCGRAVRTGPAKIYLRLLAR